MSRTTLPEGDRMELVGRLVDLRSRIDKAIENFYDGDFGSRLERIGDKTGELLKRLSELEARA